MTNSTGHWRVPNLVELFTFVGQNPGSMAFSTLTYNHEQNIVERFTKLSQIGFSLECFTTDFLQFSSTIVLSTIPSLSGIFLKFPNLSLTLFSNSRDISYIHLLVILLLLLLLLLLLIIIIVIIIIIIITIII